MGKHTDIWAKCFYLYSVITHTMKNMDESYEDIMVRIEQARKDCSSSDPEIQLRGLEAHGKIIRGLALTIKMRTKKE